MTDEIAYIRTTYGWSGLFVDEVEVVDNTRCDFIHLGLFRPSYSVLRVNLQSCTPPP